MPETSALGGEPDEIGTKADIPFFMSAIGGKADLRHAAQKSPLIAINGHWTFAQAAENPPALSRHRAWY